MKPDTGNVEAGPSGQGPQVTLEAALAAGGMAAAPAAHPAAQGARAAGARASRGLRTRLALMLATGLLPALAGTGWYLHHLREAALREAFLQADLIAMATTEKLRWLMQDAQATLESIAARPGVRAMDPQACDPIFREFGKLNPAFKALSLRRLDGSSVCSELAEPPTGSSVAAAPWFSMAVQQPGFHVSGAHVGAVTGQWTVRLTLPVLDAAGERRGLLVTPLDLNELQQRLYARLPSPAVAAVVDGHNTVLVRSHRHRERVGQPAVAAVGQALLALRSAPPADGAASGGPGQGEGASHRFVEVGLQGERQLFVARSVPMTDWVTVATLPEAHTLKGYQASRDRSLAAIAAVLLLMALAAAWVSRGILRPMQGLARAARAVARGDDSQRAPESGPREVMDVARDFNRMVVAQAEASRRLRASESHYRTLIQNLPVAVVTHRPDSTIEVFNQQACELLRMTAEQLLGKAALDRAWVFVDEHGQRLPPADYPVTRLLQTQQTLAPVVLGIAADEGPGIGTAEAPIGGPATSEGAAAPGLVPHTWCMVTGYPQFDAAAHLVRAIVVFVDVTAQREAVNLRLAKETAESASRAKSDFLSRVSHELRTPLNAINGFSELMLMDATLPPGVQHKARRILTAGQHLLSMINQILNLTQIESGRINATLQPLALAPVVQDCLAICGPLAEARHVHLGFPLAGTGAVAGTLWPATPGSATTTAADEGPLRALADETLLRQVLMNLLSNAIKYNRQGGRVEVVLKRLPAAAGDPDVAVEVCDTGLGLSPPQLAAIFQPFNRLGAEFSGIEGHGLGLAISRQLARAMGGDIVVRSEPGVGSCFTLRLRSTAPATAAEQAPVGPPPPPVRA